MSDLKNLVPRGIWEQFEAVVRIPRPSKREGKIVAFLEEFAETHGLPYRRDEIGNIVILKPASQGMEEHDTVVLQNHVDMVCEKNSDAVNAAGEPFDFGRDPIETYVSEGWVRARGTTLGADNGLGMAAVLDLLIDREAVHPPLEALFTVDEETGLTGAFNLGKGAIFGTAPAGSGMITGRSLINLDSEDWGEVFIGCAGGVDTLAYFDYTMEPAPAAHKFFEIAVSGLLGGHSGDDIEKGRGNSNKILARALLQGIAGKADDKHANGKKRTSGPEFDMRLASIDGGNLRNAIPREARAVVAVPDGKAADFEKFIEAFAADIAEELKYSDAGVSLALKPADPPASVIDTNTARRLICALVGVPNGVQAMSFAMPGLVETSTNLASVKMDADQIVVTTSQRSSVESAKEATAAAIEAVFTLAGAVVEHSDGYPGWAPNPDSHLLEVTKNAYEKLFGTEVKVRAIHAGLECGLFLEKYPFLEMISIGPTILGAHSPDERIEIATVEKFRKLLFEMLRTL